MMLMSDPPRKEVHGDPLLDAALQCSGPRAFQRGERIILTEHQPKDPEDPNYHFLCPTPEGSAPMHNYYGEFRLGHGDPLFKAAMSHWPCTTTDYGLPQTPNRSRLHAQARSKSLGAASSSSCRAIVQAAGTDLMDPTSVASLWPFADIVHLDHLSLEAPLTKERRFVLLDPNGRPIAEADDGIEELYSDF